MTPRVAVSARTCPGRRAPRSGTGRGPHGRLTTNHALRGGTGRDSHDHTRTPSTAESTHPIHVVLRRCRAPRGSAQRPHALLGKPDTEALTRRRSSENSHPVGALRPKLSQCRVGRKRQHNVGCVHGVGTVV